MQAAVDVNPVLMARLPLDFRQPGMSVHHGCDDLAAAIDSGKAGRDQALRPLGTQLASGVGCHASCRLDVNPAR